MRVIIPIVFILLSVAVFAKPEECSFAISWSSGEPLEILKTCPFNARSFGGYYQAELTEDVNSLDEGCIWEDNVDVSYYLSVGSEFKNMESPQVFYVKNGINYVTLKAVLHPNHCGGSGVFNIKMSGVSFP